MMEAIENEEKIKFTRLFLQCGFTMEKFLTPNRLAQLYERSYSRNPIMSHFIEYCFGSREVTHLQLTDIYDLCYMCTTSKPAHILKQNNCFLDPYRELFLWAVLSGRLHASEFFWMYATNQILLALIGAELCKMIARSLSGDLQGLESRYLEFCDKYIQKTYDILDSAWELNPQKALSLLDTKFAHYGYTNVIDVAWFIEAKIVISHPCFQRLIQNQWTNNLNCVHFKVITTLVNPFSVLYLNPTDQTTVGKASGAVENLAWGEYEYLETLPIQHRSESYDEISDRGKQNCSLLTTRRFSYFELSKSFQQTP